MAARREAQDGRGKQQGGSSLALRSTPNKQIQRLQQRKSQSPYPKSSPRTPVRRLAEEARHSSQSQPTSPQSPGMRAISSILGFLSLFSSAQVKSSAAFGDPEESILEDSQQNTLALADESTQEVQEGQDEDEEMEEPTPIYPSLPDSSLEDNRISSDYFAEGMSKRTYDPSHQSTLPATSFAAPKQSTPSRSAFISRPSNTANQILPPSSSVFTFGRQSDFNKSSSPALPAYPRAPAPSKVASPLAKNYDLLARFFAEKAEQEAKGRSGDSAVSLQSGEADQEEVGLTEIEVAGCLKLIEESLTQGREKDLDRLQVNALEKISNAPITPIYIDTSRYSRGRVSRSPSLPLGAAAGELSGTYGMQSRPSSSFLSPAYPRSDDAQINRSLASTFSTSSAPLKRRHRPLYLGPGQGASAASNLIRRNQQMQQQRRNIPSRPLSHSRSIAAPSWQREEIDPEDREASGSNVKRRRMEVEATVQDDDRAHEPIATNLSSSQSMPSFLFNVPSAKSDTSMQPKKVVAPVPTSPTPLPTRTATADAMLSILSTGPSIPPRSSVSSTSTSARKETESMTAEVVNPYQTRSRMMKRNSAVPNSSSLAAKEKERLKEEREKKQRAIAEAKKSKESTLEMIERTAPTQIKKGGLRRNRGVEADPEEIIIKKKKEDEEEKEKQVREARRVAADEEQRKAQVGRDQREKEEQRKKKEDAEKERQRKTEEVKKRMNQLASQSPNPSSLPSVSSQSASEVPVSTLTPSVSNAARKSISFGSTFAPKKPSPLSQADNMAPESPSSSSEQSERETTKPFSFIKPISNGFSSPSVNKPTEIPIDAPKIHSKDARQEALEVAPSMLPKFDFTASIMTKAASGPIAVDDDARRIAQEKIVSELPAFDLIRKSATSQASSATDMNQNKSTMDNVKPAVPFSFASSTTSSIVSTPMASNATSDTEGDGTAENTSSEKSVSALLSGTGEGEEDEDCLHEVRSKVWNLKEGKWIDLGIGLFKIKKNKKDSKKRILIRNEGNGKVMVNFRLMEGFKPIKDKNVVSFLGFDSKGKPTNYRCKVKTNEMAEELHDNLVKEATGK